jgi:hypothetical protein
MQKLRHAKIFDDLLRILVENWGYAGIRRRLDQLEGTNSRINPSGNSRADDRSHRRTAIDYVMNMELPTEKKALLLELATRFEQKSFLPTIGDIRNFLAMSHLADGEIRGRDAAVSKIMKILALLSEVDLDKIRQDSRYSGPSRLGPLSEAISAAASARIRAAE